MQDSEEYAELKNSDIVLVLTCARDRLRLQSSGMELTKKMLYS